MARINVVLWQGQLERCSFPHRLVLRYDDDQPNNNWVHVERECEDGLCEKKWDYESERMNIDAAVGRALRSLHQRYQALLPKLKDSWDTAWNAAMQVADPAHSDQQRQAKLAEFLLSKGEQVT